MKYRVFFFFIITALITLVAHAKTEPFDLIQNTADRSQISLNGTWRILVDPYENGFYNHRYEEKDNGYFLNAKAQNPSDLVEYDFSKSQKVQVPGDWNSQDEKLFLYEGTVWYQRDFALNKKPKKRYVIHFGAVNYKAIVYVNGLKIGAHEGGFTAFQFDVTDALKSGDNFIVVKVDNRRERDQIPTVNTDWWNYGGITRPVRLLELDETYLADYFIQQTAVENKTISGWVQLGGNEKFASKTVSIKVPELNIEKSITVDKSGRGEFSFSADIVRWTPENPKLYNVKLSYNTEVISDKVGFRHIAVEGQNILLNGKSIFLRGISIHEEAPDREGRAWTESDARKVLTWAKELGCNFVRLAHYPHNEAMVRMADEMGLLVWSEIPVYWTIQFKNKAVYKKAEQQLSEMISRDKNRAAVILWSVANETPNHKARYKFLNSLIKKARKLDPSRLITAASDTQSTLDDLKYIDDPLVSIVDVIGINSYCGWYGGTPESCASLLWKSKYNKPVIMSEVGAGALQGKHGNSDERWTEEYQADVYKNNIAMMKNMTFLQGLTPWILKDFRSPRRPLPDIQNFWNRKGLLSDKGVPKDAWHVLNRFYEEKKIEASKN